MLKANLLNNNTYKGVELDKLNRTLQLLENTVNSNRFKDAVLNFQSFQYVKYACFGPIKAKTIQLKKYTNEELFAVIMAGHQKVGNDTFMNLKLEISSAKGGSAVGETDDNDVTTTYRSAFNSWSEGQLAAHIMHEWMHTLDFEHSFSKRCDPTRDCFSVPYAIGNMIEIILTGKCFYTCDYSQSTI